ncbi:MAG: YybS family protein [Hyphomicrobiaceae bacterium]|nr:YybS family protein [Hyphomicrobiaceae bacterium]
MNSPIVIGVGAGLVSAVLFASTLTSGWAILLFYVTALPGFIAGLGWGTQAVVTSTLLGSGLVGVLMAPLAGLGYFLTLGLPTTVLCYLALLGRPANENAVTEHGATQASGAGQIEWYPVGRIIAWATLMAGSIAAMSVPMFGMDIETYRTNLQEILDKTFFSQLPEGAPPGMNKEDMAPVIELLIRTLSAASAIAWLSVMLLNMWTAAKVVTGSGRAIRPWPDFSTITYPAYFALGFVASLLGTFAPGILSIIATGFAGAFFLAYVLLGLVVLHVLARNSPYKFVALGALYLGIFLFGWVALVVAVIGIGEPMFRLREKARGAPPPDND